MGTSIDQLEAVAKTVPPGSFRHSVLQSAKRFKASWVELGKQLVKVRDDALFETWGFDSFESYCYKELRIRKATALKLVKSFSFLDRHEPQATKRDDIVENAPAFEVIEVLAEAEERGQLSASEYKSVRDSIWDPEKVPTELKREFTERFAPKEERADDGPSIRQLVSLAGRLASGLAAQKSVPRAVVERARALEDDLKELMAHRAEA